VSAWARGRAGARARVLRGRALGPKKANKKPTRVIISVHSAQTNIQPLIHRRICIRVPVGERMSDSNLHSRRAQPLTIEHVRSGYPPAWVVGHFLKQALDPSVELASGGSGRLLCIHSSDAARQQMLTLLDDGTESSPVDRTHHHSLSSLTKSLAADCRLARVLPAGGATAVLVHGACKDSASKLLFPILHPIPDHRWSRAKTDSLAKLNRALLKEDIRSWDGPGWLGYRSAVGMVESGLSAVHEDNLVGAVSGALEQRDKIPFSLRGFDGILLMGLPPTLSLAEIRLLQSLRRFLPVHQLCQHGGLAIGNHRLGLHGLILEDVPAVRDSESLPEWISTHEVWNAINEDPPAYSINRVLISRNSVGVKSATEAISSWLDDCSDINAQVLVIDPMAESRSDEWHRSLGRLGLALSARSEPLLTSPSVHWLLNMASLGYGPAAWSLDSLRGVAGQRCLPLTEAWLYDQAHPTESSWTPRPNIAHLENLARSWHIVGGIGSMEKWLTAVRAAPRPSPYQTEAQAAQVAEQCQWWLLSLANRLRPLLTRADAALLTDSDLRKGCSSGVELPLPPAPAVGDEWLTALMSSVDWAALGERMDGSTDIVTAGLSKLLESHRSMRAGQRTLTQVAPKYGSDWIEEIQQMVAGLTLPASDAALGSVRVLTPIEALGCTADLVVLTHMTLSDWQLKSEAIPFVDEAERCRLNIARLDAPLREARHCFEHLLHSGGCILLIDASGLDEDTQPAAPLAEWLSGHQGADTGDKVQYPSFLPVGKGGWSTASGSRTKGHHLAYIPEKIATVENQGERQIQVTVEGTSARDRRQRAGLALHEFRASDPPLNPSAISLSLEEDLFRDRIARMPKLVADSEQYLNPAFRHRLVSLEGLTIVPGKSGAAGKPKPRKAENWPTLGGKKGSSNLMAIDPRPLTPSATGLAVHDSRTGYENRPSQQPIIWSPSRLLDWLNCPRKGWLTRALRADAEEKQKEDLNAMERGNLIHNGLGAVFENALKMTEGVERSLKGATSLAGAKKSGDELMIFLLEFIADNAPWMRRSDAMATQRRADMIGMGRERWLDWLASPSPSSPSGRLGAMLTAELAIGDAIPLVLEWALNNAAGDGYVELHLPESPDNSLRLRGFIDRVDYVKLSGCEGVPARFITNTETEATVAPLDFSEKSTWRPHRLVIIRDMKGVDGPGSAQRGKRHRSALFRDLQLGLYARAWEITHPGDLVIAVGISEVGHSTIHALETTPSLVPVLGQLQLSTGGTPYSFTASTHRLPGEAITSKKIIDKKGEEEIVVNEPDSDPFRAWIRERLTTAIAVARNAEDGRVHPTPVKDVAVCSYCSVQAVCGLAPTVGGDKKWS